MAYLCIVNAMTTPWVFQLGKEKKSDAAVAILNQEKYHVLRIASDPC